MGTVLVTETSGNPHIVTRLSVQMVRYPIYNRLPEDEPSGSKHVEDIRKLKIIILI